MVKLSDKPLNYEILCTISSIYGGWVNRMSGIVIWVVNDKKTFSRTILPLFNDYPLLTSRIHLQLQFFLKFYNDPNVDLYFKLRNSKYSNRDKIIPLFTKIPSYFSDWLGGFIEAKGCFSRAKRRSSGNSSFSIAQNYDYYLIEAIRDFYGVSHLKISNKFEKVRGFPLYEVSIASRIGINRVIYHCISLLQGYKYIQLLEVMNKNESFKSVIKEFGNELLYVSCCQTTVRNLSTFLGIFKI